MSTETKVRPPYRWRPWKVLLLLIAAALLVGGAVLALKGESRGQPSPEAAAATRSGGAIPGVRSMLPGGTPGLPPAGTTPVPAGTTAAEGPWSPALLRGGLSFFVAFAVAFALRSFLRLGIFFVGIFAGALFLLSQAGWIDVRWDLISTSFDRFTANLGAQFESFRTFVTGSLPSTGLAGAGLFAGLRKG